MSNNLEQYKSRTFFYFTKKHYIYIDNYLFQAILIVKEDADSYANFYLNLFYILLRIIAVHEIIPLVDKLLILSDNNHGKD